MRYEAVAKLGQGHETCTYDVHNISKSDNFFSYIQVYQSIRKTFNVKNLIFLSLPIFFFSFYGYSKSSLGYDVQPTVMYVIDANMAIIYQSTIMQY